jgi:hypothetical protein
VNASTDQIVFKDAEVWIGDAPDATTGLLTVMKDQNAQTSFRVVNNTDDTDSYVGFGVYSHIVGNNQGFSVQVFSDSFNAFTGMGAMSLAGWARLRTDSQVSGFILNVAGAGELRFGTNNTLRWTIKSDGKLDSRGNAIYNSTGNNVKFEDRIYVLENQDQTSFIGRCVLGNPYSDWAGFYHYDRDGTKTVSYALIQNANGFTVLNGANGQGISFRENNVEVMAMSSSELNLKQDFNHDGTNVGFLGKAPQAQQSHIVDADGTLADITTKFNTLLANVVEGFGFTATS